MAGNTKKTGFFIWLMCAALLLCLPALIQRAAHESGSRSSLLVFDLKELHALRETRKGELFPALMESGISAFLAPEYTGEEIRKGVLGATSVLPACELPPALIGRFSSSEGSVLIFQDSSCAALQRAYLSRRFENTEPLLIEGFWYVRIPVPYGQLERSGVMPDLQSMDYLSSCGVPLIYAPFPGESASAKAFRTSLEFLQDRFSSISTLAPAGDMAASDPYRRILGDFARANNLLMAQTEFSRQYGASRLTASAWPRVVSMHGVDREEVLKRNIVRPIMLNRLLRAASEREVRLLILRLDPLSPASSDLKSYCADAASLRARLDSRGFTRLWPEKAPSFFPLWNVMATVGLHVLMILLIVKLMDRCFRTSRLSERKTVLMTLAGGTILGAASWFAPALLRMSGAVTAGLLATEASLRAMALWRVPLRGPAESLLVAVAGGLVLAAPFSTPLYMYRMQTFSGVKLTLLLPLLLVLLIDLKKREHHESLTEILSRPPFWGELVLAGAMLLGACVMILRSGNFGFVSTREILIRDWLEAILIARPRTKEFLIGYPALVLWYWLKRGGMWDHWREVFRLGVTLAFSSAVNSFCHFHTPLSLTLLRVLNGWWIGLLLGGFALIAILKLGYPIFERLRGFFAK